MFLKVLAVVLSAFVTLSGFPGGSLAEYVSAGKCEISLRRGEGDDGIFEVIFEAIADEGICGILGAIAYDADKLILLSVGAECGGSVFSYVDKGGEVRFLIDGVENVEKIEVSLFFGFAEEGDGDSIVRILCAEVLSLNDRQIVELDTEIANGTAEIRGGDGERAENDISPIMPEWRWNNGGESIALTISGAGKGGYYFAGVDLFIVRCDGGGEKMLVTRKIPSSGEENIEISVPLGNKDFYTIIITAVVFKRNGSVRGEKTVVVN